MPIMLHIMWRVMLTAPFTLMRINAATLTATAGTTDGAKDPEARVETQRPLGEGEGEDQFGYVFTQARPRDAAGDGPA